MSFILILISLAGLIYWNITGYRFYAILTFIPFLIAALIMVFTEKRALKLARFLLLTGGSMNFLAISFNSFKMPVFDPGSIPMDLTHSVADSSTLLPLLCDRFHVLHMVASAGDFVLLASCVTAIVIAPFFAKAK